LKVLKNRVLREFYWLKRDGIIGLRKLNEELRNLYPLPSVIRIIKRSMVNGRKMYHVWGRRVHTAFWWQTWKLRDQYKTRCRWKDNIRVGVTEMGWGYM
jgi:hypothetical protein